jgi:hypothetical protein
MTTTSPMREPTYFVLASLLQGPLRAEAARMAQAAQLVTRDGPAARAAGPARKVRPA